MSRRPHRAPAGGRIDRSRIVTFTLEGRPLAGVAGDTLASALLANGISLVGRSFKYHRPRGFLGAGVEEPNGLFTVGRGARATPNLPGTLVELHEGLAASRQNGTPSVGFDLMAVNDLLSPLLGAGFYYKTFMGPLRGSWMFYERFIRRAAGLGVAPSGPDPDRYETRHAFADVLVVGAGPAGLAAARAAGEAGARVVLVEQDTLAGGGLLALSPEQPLERWREDALRALADLPEVQVLTRTTALGLYDGNTVALLGRSAHGEPDAAHGEAREWITTLRARAIVFATGAIERPLVFADNDRPGVMLASAAQAYRNRWAVSLGERVVLGTNNDSGWMTAAELARGGAELTLIEQRAAVTPALRAMAEEAGVRVHTGGLITRAIGSRAVRAAQFSTGSGRDVTLPCDLLCMSGGWSCSVHLGSHTGIKPVYRADIDSMVPGSLPEGQFAAGAANGTFSLAGAVREGVAAGQAAARHTGFGGARVQADAELPDTPYTVQPAVLPPPRRGKAFADFQSDVSTHDVQIAHEEGFVAVEHLKRYTALGMATDQGKTSNLNGMALMAAMRGQSPGGTTTFRPPWVPMSIGALAGRSTGQHFRPARRSPLHDWHVANGAVFTEAGPWLRPWYYRWAGDSPESAYLAEMHLVRETVGISDISSLGKIELHGPDVGEFLDRVYVNVFSSLAVGKARYGVMLNDDATVLDDGTCARLADTRWFLTTTTAQAGEVMSHLEFLLQTAWTDLRVQAVSVTDQYAGMSVAGPHSRKALELALPGHDVSDAALPHMGCLEITHEGVALKVLRLSFSGELAFEVYAPADRGIAVWEHILRAAAPLGIRPYGLEALASLRIEKGHVAGSMELDHRNTLDDLGLGRMASTRKAFIGQELRQRPGLQAPQRWSLVGLECLDPDKTLRGGAILFAAGDEIAGHGRGHITSVTWSVVLGKTIALGLYRGGLAHAGEEIICAYPLKGEQVRARIVSPVFIDPEGERLHA